MSFMSRISNARLTVQLRRTLQLMLRLGSESNRQLSGLEPPALPMSYRAVALPAGFEPALPRLELGLQPSAFQELRAEPWNYTTHLSQRVRVPRYLGLLCGARSQNELGEAVKTAPGKSLRDHRRVLPGSSGRRFDDLRQQSLAHQRHVATQPPGLRTRLDHDSGELVIDIRFVVQSDPKATLVRGCRDASQGIFVRDSHQDNEVALNHPACRNETMLAGEFKRGVR